MGRTRLLLLRRSAIAVLASALIAVGVAPPAEAHSGSSWTSGYVALGDSYAAGEGLPPFEPGTDGADGCHRSAAQSYPVLLAESGRHQFDGLVSVACSGARTVDLVASVPGSTQPPQVGALNRRTRTVTVTIGGNDAGFGLVFGDCVYSPEPAVQAALPGSPGCAERDDATVSAAIAALAGGHGAPSVPGLVPLPSVLAAIGAAAPQATVYVTGYPRLFGRRQTDAAGCRVNAALPLYISGPDARWIRRKAGDLDAAIRTAVKRARARGADIRYVDVATAFRRHDLCDSGESWVNGVVLTPTAPGQAPQIGSATFHPTARGQQAYAAAVQRVVPSRSTHPMPQN